MRVCKPRYHRADWFTRRAEPRLKAYGFYLKDIAPARGHTLSDAEEKILADAGAARRRRRRTSSRFSRTPISRIRPSRSATARRRSSTRPASHVRALPEPRRPREGDVGVLPALGGFSRTFGTTMNGEVQKALFFAKARKYPSSLEAALDGPNIPVSVYTRLIDGVNTNLPTFHRYLRLRKRMMGLDELHYYDLMRRWSAPSTRLHAEEAQKHMLAAWRRSAPSTPPSLQRGLQRALDRSAFRPGKRSGAYSNGGAYDVHPYMLMNYNGKYDDMSTLAHELGHTMQSYFSNKTQPYPLADYPTFVAEVASTFNESLLIDYMLEDDQGRRARLSLLGNYLEGIKGTVFRQTQFAEFELRMHEMAEKGEPLTGDALAKLYMDITKRYYGHDKGVCVVDDYIAHEWSYIPHFYRDFYVFQYATSFTASEALAAEGQGRRPGATKRYLAFLAAGGSKYPIDLLKDAGVDMTTDEPLELTMKEMNRVMDEMEAMLAKRPRQ